jgi:hypothetical protein
MATVTREKAQLEGGACVWSYDYDDATFTLLNFRCVNDSNFKSEGSVWPSGHPEWMITRVVGSHTTETFSVPSAAAARFGIGIDARGRITGLDSAFRMLGVG